MDRIFRRGLAALFLMFGALPMVGHAQASQDRSTIADSALRADELAARALLSPAGSCQLQGVTRSPSGLLLPQTQITVHSVNDNVTHSLLSGPNGEYFVVDLKPGRYELIVNKPGFSASSKIAIELEARQNLHLDLTVGTAQSAAEQPMAPPSSKTADATDTQKYILEEVQRLEARLAELEARLASQPTAAAVAAVAPANSAANNSTNNNATPGQTAEPASPSNSPAAASSQPQADAGAAAVAAQSPTPTKDPAAASAKAAPFSDADWSWLNGNPRTKDIFWDTPFFTPEIRTDTDYVYDFNHPADHSMGGSSELFRSQEVQLEQLGVGGDFH